MAHSAHGRIGGRQRCGTAICPSTSGVGGNRRKINI